MRSWTADAAESPIDEEPGNARGPLTARGRIRVSRKVYPQGVGVAHAPLAFEQTMPNPIGSLR
jgi:hypothetical protein